MQSNTVAVTGKPQDELWREYEEWLRARFAAATPPTGKRPDQGGEILARAFSLTSPLLAPEGERWYVRGDGYTRPKLVRQAKGAEAGAVRGIEALTRLPVAPRGELARRALVAGGNRRRQGVRADFRPGGEAFPEVRRFQGRDLLRRRLRQRGQRLVLAARRAAARALDRGAERSPRDQRSPCR